jgi:hypothetical protein
MAKDDATKKMDTITAIEHKRHGFRRAASRHHRSTRRRRRRAPALKHRNSVHLFRRIVHWQSRPAKYARAQT